MVEERIRENEPNVLVFFDIPHLTNDIFLVVKNIGKSMAKNVRLEFNPELKNSRGELMDEVLFLKNGIPVMPPGYRIQTFIGMDMNTIEIRSYQENIL